MEINKYLYRDLHSYSDKMRTLKEDFASLKNAKCETEVDAMLEKYEQFMEYSFHVSPWVRKRII